MTISITSDRDVEFFCDVKGIGLSNCCSASVYQPDEDVTVCSSCLENCEIVDSDE